MGSYTGTEGYSNAYKEFMARHGWKGAEYAQQTLDQAGEQFRQSFNRSVGRDPTDGEADRFFKNVLSGDDVTNAARPGMLNNYINSFIDQNFYETAQDYQRTAQSEKAKGNYGAVNDTFKELLNRDATDAEKDHFGKMLASGDVDAFTLRSFLQQTPEYVRPRLEKQDTEYFQKNLAPALESRFAQSGRVAGPALYAAFANASGDVNRERERYLEGIGREDYMGQVAQNYSQQQYQQGRNDSLQNYYRGRGDQFQDYNTQKAAYDDYLRRYGVRKKSNGLGGLLGGLTGAGLGAYAGGPAGAASGYGVGSGLGSYFDQ